MNIPTFYSPLKNHLDGYGRLLQARQRDYRVEAYRLRDFDRYLSSHMKRPGPLTRDLVLGWTYGKKGLAPITYYQRFRLIGRFCSYLADRIPKSYVPDPIEGPTCVPRNRSATLFSHEQIRRLIEAARRLGTRSSEPLRAQTYTMLFGLLYTTGLRISEALRLRLGDVDVRTGVLTVRETKFKKSRLVVLSPSAQTALALYLRKRQQMRYPLDPQSHLLGWKTGGRIDGRSVGYVLACLLKEIGWPEGAPRPRIHDTRHSFAVHRLLAWYQDGQDITGRLPHLSVYMGHVNIHNTAYYLQATPELLAVGAERFHRFAFKTRKEFTS